MGKILAIDFGLKRTGLALSDEACVFAFGLETVNSNQLMLRIKELVEKERIETFVVGLPMNLKGQDTDVTENVRLFSMALKTTFPSIPCEWVDERFTSTMAAQSMHVAGATRKQKKEKGLVDKVSATLILQSYLQRKV